MLMIQFLKFLTKVWVCILLFFLFWVPETFGTPQNVTD